MPGMRGRRVGANDPWTAIAQAPDGVEACWDGGAGMRCPPGGAVLPGPLRCAPARPLSWLGPRSAGDDGARDFVSGGGRVRSGRPGAWGAAGAEIA